MKCKSDCGHFPTTLANNVVRTIMFGTLSFAANAMKKKNMHSAVLHKVVVATGLKSKTFLWSTG